MAWTPPIDWQAGAIVTASQLNTELRDHLNYLKGFADNVTNNTTAETGDDTQFYLLRDAGFRKAYEAGVTGDAFPSVAIQAGGRMQWSPGTGDYDTYLERTGIGDLTLGVMGGVGAARLVVQQIGLLDATGFMDFKARSGGAPGVADTTNTPRVYADVSGGKARLMVRFNTGASQVIATEP